MTGWAHEQRDAIHHVWRWRGWRIDLWTDCGIAGMYHATRTTVLEFGTVDELAARAALLEATDDR
jgi:hypothetical protein